jgi:endoglucanase
VSRLQYALISLCAVAGSLAQVQPNPTYEPPAATSGTTASPPSDPSQQWSTLLGNMLYFYDVQRAGVIPDDFRVDWRNTSVLNDGSDVKLNLSGGFFDAGNYIKATFPLCWVVTQLSWGAMMYGSGYDRADQTAYLDETLRTALDWLMEAAATEDSMVVLIGSDDVYWGGDQVIPTNRPSYVITRQKPGTDVFGSCASAITSASLLYRGTTLPLSATQNGTVASLQDTTYSATLLATAEKLFNLAQTSTPQQVYQKAVSGVSWAYPSTDYADELVLSSTFLAMATGNETYAQYAQSTFTTNQFPYANGALNWDQHTPATPVLLAQLAIMEPNMNVSFTLYQNKSEIWLDNIIDGSMAQTFSTPGGLFWFDGDSDDASLNPSLNAAFLMTVYHGMASSTLKGAGYLNWTQSQVNYALGDNPMNAVYPVGMHPNSAQNPQSALASGGTNINFIDTQPPTELHVLYGGVVGGPDKKDNYYDERGYYQQTEVAVDSQSALMTVAAYHIVNNSSDPYYVGLTQPRVILPYTPDSGSGSSGLSEAGKIGIAVAVLIVFFAILGAICYWQRERIRNRFRRGFHKY